ncbi:MAG: nucleotidyltransferase domain-containing protein [Candidatus Hydrogenedentes bacterium]|nr:nucleotidyltransferase domain-containing protein [Candidatus Hydrogenedentota bacterium]
MTIGLAPILDDLKDRLSRLYGARLQGVYLYGSYARQEDSAESDVDVLIVLDRVDSYCTEVTRTGELVSELSLELGRTISCVFLPMDRWLNGETMFVLNARKDAVPV